MQSHPECIPASSMCCIIPATKTFLPSDIASTSTSIALSINLSIKIGFFSATLNASFTKFLSCFFHELFPLLFHQAHKMALPLKANQSYLQFLSLEEKF